MNMYTLLCLKWITNKDLLYSKGNSVQCYVAAWMRGKFGGEMSTRIIMAESLCCSPETITTKFIGCTPTQASSQVGQWWRICRPMGEAEETLVQPLGQEDLEEQTATCSSILAWRIPGTAETGGLQPMGCKEFDTIRWLSTHTHPNTKQKKKFF